jgi:hypothetical protein
MAANNLHLSNKIACAFNTLHEADSFNDYVVVVQTLIDLVKGK